ncbi:hypothetical protein PR202_ga02755 [Eleusine coracana subsp. coracana]|uniref:Uncharacterized protein n=1 Tax=Eleusine coracana subsp. coracana TaxID=191504 RepID=A0AAV5BLT1_ELECO|nr:hypothetical protein PR202_ga02755 [Eleusine coracana subsp. coracana]
MLHLRSRLLSGVRAAASLRHHLLLSTTPASPSCFVAEDFLVTRCGLTPAQALKSSKHLAHLKSPANPEAVLAFLTNIGLGKGDIASAIARDPCLLCSKVDNTLTPRVAELLDLGLSPLQISTIITAIPCILRRSVTPRFQFYISFLGSCEKLCSVLRRNWGGRLLSQDVERVVKPNIAFLQQCGLNDSEISKLLMLAPIILLEPENAKDIVECADKLGVPRDSPMFKHALKAIFLASPARINAKLDFLKKALGCSRPRPAVLSYSLKKRLMPRYFVLQALKVKGLLKKDVDFYNVVSQIEKKFAKRFLDPYKETVPGLAGAYAAASAREAGSSKHPGIQL